MNKYPKTARRVNKVFRIILLVVIILSIFTLLIYIYQAQNYNNSSSSGTDTSNTDPTDITGSNMFLIPELGIKFELPESLSGLRYEVIGNSEGLTTIGLTTTSLENIDGEGTLCVAKSAAIGTLTRTSIDPEANDFPTYIGAPAAVGGFYIAYRYPQSGCSYDKSAGELQTDQSRAVEELLENGEIIEL